MRKGAIRAASYLYMAGAAILALAAVLNLFEEPPRALFAAGILGLVAFFCGYMAAKSRELLRVNPISSRSAVAVWAAATVFVGGIGGLWLMLSLLIPFALLAWAVHPGSA